MQYTKFVVKVSRLGAPCAEYIQRIDRKPIQTTIERKRALLMGKVTAMEVLKSLGNSRWSPEMVAVQVKGQRPDLPPHAVEGATSILDIMTPVARLNEADALVD